MILAYTHSVMKENESTEIVNPCDKVKQIGLPSLEYVAEKVGIPRRTLHDWSTTRPKAFKALLVGVFFMDKVETYINFIDSIGDTDGGK